MSDGYRLRISPLTVDKLGVKLYDKASAVVAELLANGYDADAEHMRVCLPLGTELARKDTNGSVADHGYTIEVRDDGHGMTPEEARRFYLDVGRDRRQHADQGPASREKQRPVMGRKGIGKLAPFGICRCIEVISAGGERTEQGYLTTHFYLDYDRIMQDVEPEERDGDGVPLKAGEHDGTYRESRGTVVRLTQFWPRRVPDRETFMRQLERRFAVARDDVQIVVEDTRPDERPEYPVSPFQVPTLDGTRIDLTDRPVYVEDGSTMPVSGWLGLAKEAYKNEEMAGVRVYARGKIVATTRDFEQPAGYTGEFTTRSYLVGEVHAEWLDLDTGDDLIRTDRQDILWDSEYGRALRTWGSELIREIGAASREPRRKRVQGAFMERSRLEEVAKTRFADQEVVDAAVALGKQVGAFAAEDELEDTVYIEGLREVILTVAPHRALIGAFQNFSQQTLGVEAALETLVDLFGKTRVAEMASYSQIAHERVKVIRELEELLLGSQSADEAALQDILTQAPYLIEPTWTVITHNQQLKTFKAAFEKEYKERHGEEVVLGIEHETKRPDFVMVNIGGLLHIVEIKAPSHRFDDKDFERLHRYVEAFEKFEQKHPGVMQAFSRGWRIDLVADGVAISQAIARTAYEALAERQRVVQISWIDFLTRAKNAHEQFLDAHDKAQAAAPRDS